MMYIPTSVFFRRSRVNAFRKYLEEKGIKLDDEDFNLVVQYLMRLFKYFFVKVLVNRYGGDVLLEEVASELCMAEADVRNNYKVSVLIENHMDDMLRFWMEKVIERLFETAASEENLGADIEILMEMLEFMQKEREAWGNFSKDVIEKAMELINYYLEIHDGNFGNRKEKDLILIQVP